MLITFKDDAELIRPHLATWEQILQNILDNPKFTLSTSDANYVFSFFNTSITADTVIHNFLTDYIPSSITAASDEEGSATHEIGQNIARCVDVHFRGHGKPLQTSNAVLNMPLFDDSDDASEDTHFNRQCGHVNCVDIICKRNASHPLRRSRTMNNISEQQNSEANNDAADNDDDDDDDDDDHPMNNDIPIRTHRYNPYKLSKDFVHRARERGRLFRSVRQIICVGRQAIRAEKLKKAREDIRVIALLFDKSVDPLQPSIQMSTTTSDDSNIMKCFVALQSAIRQEMLQSETLRTVKYDAQ